MRNLSSALLLFVATFSLATENQIDFNFGRGTPISAIQADGSSEKAGARGTNWSGDILHQTAPHAYVGLGGGQFRSNDHVSGTFVPNTTSTITSKITSILLLTRVDIPSRSKLVPYVIAGVGWARNSLTITGEPESATMLLHESRDSIAYATGLGMDYPISDRLFIGVEGRYQGSLSKTFELTPQGQALTGKISMDTPMNTLFVGVKAGIKY